MLAEQKQEFESKKPILREKYKIHTKIKIFIHTYSNYSLLPGHLCHTRSSRHLATCLTFTDITSGSAGHRNLDHWKLNKTAPKNSLFHVCPILILLPTDETGLKIKTHQF